MLQGHLVGLAVLDVPLPVKEPVGDLVLAGVLREGELSHTFWVNTFWVKYFNQDIEVGIRYTCIIVMSFSVSSSVSSPALLERGMSAFFSTMLAYLETTRLTKHQT